MMLKTAQSKRTIASSFLLSAALFFVTAEFGNISVHFDESSGLCESIMAVDYYHTQNGDFRRLL